MPTQTHNQLPRWMKIFILQKYVTIDEFRFPIGDSADTIMSSSQAQKALQRLISQTCKDYNLLPPEEDQPDPPRKTYNSWHHEMMVLFCCVNYSKMLCFLCPFSLGTEEMIKREGAAPCSLLGETKLFSLDPIGCIVLTTDYWDEKFLFQHIMMHHGADKAADFISIKTAFYV